MEHDRLVLLVASVAVLLSPGCAKLNASFTGDAEGGTSGASATAGEASDGPGTDSADPTAGSDSADTKATSGPSSTTHDTDSTGTNPSEATSDTGIVTSGETETPVACGEPQGECLPLGIACGQGFRCRPYDSDNDNLPDAFRCFESPVSVSGGDCEAPCGPFSGNDSCAAALLCDPFDDTPRCVPMCSAEEGCAIGVCNTDGLPGETYGLCRAACNPLTQDCPGAQICVYADSNSPSCVDPTEDYEPGEGCEFADHCAVGLACAPAGSGGGCEGGGASCCTPFCSLAEPECLKGLTCVPVEPAGSTSNTDVGVCVAN